MCKNSSTTNEPVNDVSIHHEPTVSEPSTNCEPESLLDESHVNCDSITTSATSESNCEPVDVICESTTETNDKWSDDDLAEQLADVQRHLQLKQQMLDESPDDEVVVYESLSKSPPSSEKLKDVEHLDLGIEIEKLRKLDLKQSMLDESSDENNTVKTNEESYWKHNPLFNATDEEQEHLLLEFDDDVDCPIYNHIDRISLSDSCAESYYGGSDSERSFRGHEMNHH